MLVVDKPAGMVVHPGAGHARGTLAAALLAHAPDDRRCRRTAPARSRAPAGQGYVGAARRGQDPAAYDSLTAQLAARTVSRRYLAVVHGRVGRAARRRRCADRPPSARPGPHGGPTARAGQARRDALPRPGALLPTSPVSRRSSRRGARTRSACTPVHRPPNLWRRDVHACGHRDACPFAFDGIALHAAALAFVHPVTGRQMGFTSPLPRGSSALLAYLREGHDVC